MRSLVGYNDYHFRVLSRICIKREKIKGNDCQLSPSLNTVYWLGHLRGRGWPFISTRICVARNSKTSAVTC